MASDKLAELYEHYNKLDTAAKENISQCEANYLAILSARNGSPQEKQLCSQFISKFFVHFPTHYEVAIDALLDLCEDDDANIRRRAIKELPSICRERKEFTIKIADVLAQLLLSEDPIELTIVNQSLTTLANYDIKSVFSALFAQILEGEEDTREKVIKFLRDRFRLINASLLTKEIEEFFLEEAKKVLTDVTKDEFLTLMELCRNLKISKTLNGHNALLAIIKEQAELNNEFNPSDSDSLDKLLMCIRHGAPYFSQFSPSTEFVLYICTKVLPNYSVLESQQTGNDLELLQSLAEITPFISPNVESQEIEKCQNAVFSLLLNFIPKPPQDLAAESTADNSGELPSTQFSHVECLLFAFHQLCKLNPNYFSESNADTLKDFKLRLQYLARGLQSCINKLRKAISLLKPQELKSPENKIKVIATKATTNINALIKDFFKIPPSYKSTISLSFKQQAKPGPKDGPVEANTTKTGKNESVATVSADSEKPAAEDSTDSSAAPTRKRAPITAPEGVSEPKRERTSVYAPPAGKFSGNNSFRRYSGGSNNNRNNNRGRFSQGRGGGGPNRGFGGRKNFSARY